MQELETRFFTTRYDTAKRQVHGYAAVFYDGSPATEYALAPGTVERIHPDAFDASLKGGKIKLYRMHDRKQGLARQPNTLRLAKDAKGVAYEASIMDTTVGRDALTELESGYLTGASVGMRFGPDDVKLTREGGKTVATVMRADLVEISLVDDAAYSGATAILRWADEQKNMTLDDMENEVRTLDMRIRAKEPKK